MANDKLSALYSIKIPEKLSNLLTQLDEQGHDQLRSRIRYEIAKVVHERVMFDPELYLSSSPEAVQSLLGKLIPKNEQVGKLNAFRRSSGGDE